VEDRESERAKRRRRAGRVQVPAGDNFAFPSVSPNAWWRKRAGFVNHHVWVTPYRADEKYGAATTRTRAAAARPDPLDRADRPIEKQPTSSFGTRWATRTSRGRGLPGDADAYIGFTLKTERLLHRNPPTTCPPSTKQKVAGGCLVIGNGGPRDVLNNAAEVHSGIYAGEGGNDANGQYV